MQENNDNAYTTSLKIDTDTNRIIATAEEQADSRSSSGAQGGGVTGAAAVAVGPGARPARCLHENRIFPATWPNGKQRKGKQNKD